jgi:hypothetical protein
VGLPVFFCEFCGAEVPDDATSCPRCNKRFAGVKCPACRYEGSYNQFVDGCPSCHYKPFDNNAKTTSSRALAKPKRQTHQPAHDPTSLWIGFASTMIVATILVFIFSAVFL